MSQHALKRSQIGYAAASENEEIERLLVELERVSAMVERTAAAAVREAAEQGGEIDRLLSDIRAGLARNDEWIGLTSAI